MADTASARPNSLEIRALPSQLTFIALVLGIPFGIATTPWIFRDGDTGWQVAAGRWIMSHGQIPNTDPFSYTAAGHPWVAMEWLSEVIYAGAYGAAGYAGLATVVAAALIALHASVFFHLEKRAPTAMVAATLIMMDLVLAPFVLARPHVLAWPLIAGWTALLSSAAEKGRPPPLWTALILVVWTNLHASFPLAILIAGAIGVDALIAVRWSTVREWALFGGTSLVAVCLNANGIDGILQPFRTSSLGMLPLLAEWHRSSPYVTPFFFAVLLIAISALVWSRKRVPIGRLLLLLLLVGMALAHVRHQPVVAIVAACLLPPLWRSTGTQMPVPRWLLLGALPMLAFRMLWPLVLPENQANPRSLIAAVPADLKTKPVFNAYIFGGPLILAGIRPYIDGRAEIYGDDFVADYVRISRGDLNEFNRAVARYGIQWTMLPRSDTRLVDAIEKSGRWRRVYADGVGVIDVRSGS